MGACICFSDAILVLHKNSPVFIVKKLRIQKEKQTSAVPCVHYLANNIVPAKLNHL